MLDGQDVSSGKEISRFPTADEAEKEYFLRLLVHTGGNKKVAASIAGVSRGTLYRKIEKYHITF